MHTRIDISAAALAVALLASPQLSLAQGLNLDLGIVAVDANIGLGGNSLLDVDAGVTLGGNGGTAIGAGVTLGSTDSQGSLLDVDISTGSTRPATGPNGGATGPNGGTLINLGGPARPNAAALDVDIDVLPRRNSVPTTTGNRLLSGDIRLGAIGSDSARGEALLGLITTPNLADIDLDAAIDDRRVAITAVADLLGADQLAVIHAAIGTGGAGRGELLSSLSASRELGSILGRQGIDLEDVLAIQIAENGAAEIFVLGDTVTVALLGDNGNLLDVGVGGLADIDIDLFPDNGPGPNPAPNPGPNPGPTPGGGNGGGNGGNAGTTPNGGSITLPPTRVGARFSIASLNCEVGIVALAKGVQAPPQAILRAQTLELVRIEGCERSLVDNEAASIRAAIAGNPAIAGVLEAAAIPLDQVIGATIRGGALTLFIKPAQG